MGWNSSWRWWRSLWHSYIEYYTTTKGMNEPEPTNPNKLLLHHWLQTPHGKMNFLSLSIPKLFATFGSTSRESLNCSSVPIWGGEGFAIVVISDGGLKHLLEFLDFSSRGAPAKFIPSKLMEKLAIWSWKWGWAGDISLDGNNVRLEPMNVLVAYCYKVYFCAKPPLGRELCVRDKKKKKNSKYQEK